MYRVTVLLLNKYRYPYSYIHFANKQSFQIETYNIVIIIFEYFLYNVEDFYVMLSLPSLNPLA